MIWLGRPDETCERRSCVTPLGPRGRCGCTGRYGKPWSHAQPTARQSLCGLLGKHSLQHHRINKQFDSSYSARPGQTDEPSNFRQHQRLRYPAKGRQTHSNMAARMQQGGRPGGARFAQFKLVLLGANTDAYWEAGQVVNITQGNLRSERARWFCGSSR